MAIVIAMRTERNDFDLEKRREEMENRDKNEKKKL